jgi:hypothetical protein
MGVSRKAGRAAGAPARSGRFRPVTMIMVFDVAGPLALYNMLRSAGLTAVMALLLSGVFPALGVTVGILHNRRLDVVGVLVIAGIAVGVGLGLASHSAELVLAEGSVPTTIFGVACLASLTVRRPLMFSFALEFTGPGTAKGREMTRLWHHKGFRRIWRVITAVWGAGFLLEAALRVVIVYNAPAGTALASSKVMPFVFAAILSAWTAAYGTLQKRKGERLAAAASTEPGASAHGTGKPDKPAPHRAGPRHCTDSMTSN